MKLTNLGGEITNKSLSSPIVLLVKRTESSSDVVLGGNSVKEAEVVQPPSPMMKR